MVEQVKRTCCPEEGGLVRVESLWSVEKRLREEVWEGSKMFQAEEMWRMRNAGLLCLAIPRNSLTHVMRCALFILYVLLNPVLLTIKFSFQRSKGAGESRRCPDSWLECHLLKLGKEQLKR